MKKNWFDSLAQLPERALAAIDIADLGGSYPFLSRQLLAALELSGCVAPDRGWRPQHLYLQDMMSGSGSLLMPCYIKGHSWGEYVFDQDWAQAYERYGWRYYPKLISAIPFTPAVGPRWRVEGGGIGCEKLLAPIVDSIKQRLEELQLSSWHCLFPADMPAECALEQGLLQRQAYQFHWFNRGYEDFDSFLGAFTSRKRKSVRKERQQIQQRGIRFQRQSGDQLSAQQWQQFCEFYADTYVKRGHQPHLSLAFFQILGQQLGSQMLVDWAYLPGADGPVAAALFFFDSETLYGRYWGCREEVPGLHFEVCFYRGIEFAIEQKLQRFDPGAQGEHKISRGFEPIETYSWHWICDPQFRKAIAQYLAEEKRYLARYREAVVERLPFRAGG